MSTATGRPKDATSTQLVHIRLPQPLALKLRAYAARNGRAINTELHRMIQAALINEPEVDETTDYTLR